MLNESVNTYIPYCIVKSRDEDRVRYLNANSVGSCISRTPPHVTFVVSFSCSLNSLSLRPCLTEDSREQQAAVEPEEERQRLQNDLDDNPPGPSEIDLEIMLSERADAKRVRAPQGPVTQSQEEDDRPEEVASSDRLPSLLDANPTGVEHEGHLESRLNDL